MDTKNDGCFEIDNKSLFTAYKKGTGPLNAKETLFFESMRMVGGRPSNNVDGLDHDHDGIACESLP
ncbi:excalibur calcium-binding domain-containing protein [Polycladomyces abyssicola]|uniref:excalibur calcium-binding domain-containing protein n=1 Tax=Polycladomyces abyssicola TaxID=1125966 RepID=UPI001BB2E18E